MRIQGRAEGSRKDSVAWMVWSVVVISGCTCSAAPEAPRDTPSRTDSLSRLDRALSLERAHAAAAEPPKGKSKDPRESGGQAVWTHTVVYKPDPQRARVPSASTRVIFHLTRVAKVEWGTLPALPKMPETVYVDLPDVVLSPEVQEPLWVKSSGLHVIRPVQLDGKGRWRVLFTVDPRAAIDFFILPDPFRLVADVRNRKEEGPRPRAAGPMRPVRLVVLDPGHGGSDPGAARTARFKESLLTLDLALRSKHALARKLPQTEVVLTRTQDQTVSLEQRTAIANTLGADLFVSIHINDADAQVKRGGVTTFVLDTTDDNKSLRLAAAENGTSVSQLSALSRLVGSLQRRTQVEQSAALAALVQERVVGSGRLIVPRLRDRGVKSSVFYVLVGAQMPAVLLEASFMGEDAEGAALADSRYRQALADGLADALYLYSKGASSGAATAAPPNRAILAP